MTEIATAYVRLRPKAGAQFTQEARREVQSSLRSVLQIGAGVTGGVIAVDLFRDLGRAIKGAAAAAAEEEVRADLLSQAVDNAGASHRAFGQDIETLIDKESRLKGFTDQELSSAFARLVQATGDSEQAFIDLGSAEDVARIRKIELGQAAIAEAKAEQGSTTALARLGVIIPKVHTEFAALTKRRDEAVASGAKFTKSQDLIFKSAVEEAKAHDLVSDRLKFRQTLQERFGGSATRFANTTSGQFARLKVAVNELDESLGKDLLPPLASAAEGTAGLVKNLQDSKEVTDAVRASGHLFGQTLHFIGDVAREIGPPLLIIAKGANEVASAIGAPALLTGIATYKAAGIAVAGFGVAQATVTKIMVAGNGALETNTGLQSASGAAASRAGAEYVGYTGALAANTAALEANAAASRLNVAGFATSQFGARAAKTEVAALGAATARAEVQAGAAARGGFATFSRGVGTLALGAVGGVTGLAVIGVAALAGGIAYAATRTSDFDRAAGSLRSTIGLLNTNLNATKNLLLDVAQSKIDLALAKDSKAAADAAVQQAQANEVATRGTAEHQAAVLALKTARDQDAAAALAVTRAEQRGTATRRAVAENDKAIELGRQAALKETLRLARATQANVIPAPTIRFGTFGRGPTSPAVETQAQRDAADQATRFAAALDKQAQANEKTAPGLARSLRLLDQYALAVQRLPDEREIKFILDPANAKQSLKEIERDLGTTAEAATGTARRRGREIGIALSDGVRSGLDDTQAKVAAAAGRMVDAGVSGAKSAAEARSPSARTAREIGLPLAQGIAVGIDAGAPEIQRSLTDTVGDAIRQGGEQVADAINQAKQNLNSIGSGLASTIGTFIDQGPLGQQIQKLQDRLTARQNVAQRGQLEQSVKDARKALADAQAAVDTGGPVTPGIQKGINEFLTGPRQQLAQARAALADFQAQQRITALQGRSEDLKDATTRGIADVTNEVNKGLLSIPEANRRIAAILAKDDIDYRRAGKSLGSAFADSYLGQLQGLRDQMVALVGAPRLPGSGLVPSIVRPLDTLRDVTKSIAQAAKDQRAQQIAEAKQQTQLLKDIKAKQLGAAFTASLPPATKAKGRK